MKVTIITREYPPNVYGGAGVHVYNLSRELSKLMEVEVRCFGDQDWQENNLKVKGYKPMEKLKEISGMNFTSALDTLSTDISILKDRIDSAIVHTHTWYASYAGYLAKMLYGIPLVVTCHSLEPLRPWKQDQLGRGYYLSTWVEKLAIESADKIVAVSQMMKEDIMKYFNVSSYRIVVIHNGIDLNKWKKTPLSNALKKEYGIKDDYILFVGRPTKQKGMEYLIEAMDYIDKNIQLVMGAVGADTKEYEEEIGKKIAHKKNILWINKLLEEEQYMQLYSNALVFVCPSIYEPFGIINLEAMACQTPVVASAVGGIKEVVLPEKTGLLVEPANPKQLAEGINRLLKDRALAQKMGKEGRKRVEERFSWAYIAGETKKMYESLFKMQ